MARLFNTTAEHALYEISYPNAILYSKAMPMYGDGDEERKDDMKNLYDESLDACNPDNFKYLGKDEIIVR